MTPKESIMEFLREPNSELQKVEDFLLVKRIANLTLENKQVSEELAKGIKVAWDQYLKIRQAV